MTRLTRRRFLTIAAGLAALPAIPARAELHEWRGIALGARARILIDHPDAAAISTEAAAEIARLERIFSLYRADSALSRLNAEGCLAAPPFELLECLSICGAVHRATGGGLFDPTIQPLWALYAQRLSAGQVPDKKEIAATLAHVGWTGVSANAGAIRLRRGMALTLNDVGQGYIADRVAGLLADRGLTDILIDTGEFRALGGMPDGQSWPVDLAGGGRVGLSDRALASSSVLGTTFDAAGKVGHILHPATGRPALPRWGLVTVTARSAGLADALSTAACLMPDRAAIESALATFPDARLAGLSDPA
jgi:thiamine biosynthesis lipoprotein